MLLLFGAIFLVYFTFSFNVFYILAVGSYHNLEVAWFYHVLQICVVELEHIWGDIKAYLLALTYCQMDALETFQLFTGRRCWLPCHGCRAAQSRRHRGSRCS